MCRALRRSRDGPSGCSSWRASSRPHRCSGPTAATEFKCLQRQPAQVEFESHVADRLFEDRDRGREAVWLRQ